MNAIKLILASLALLGASQHSYAGLLLSGTFDVSFANPTQGVSNVTGSYTATFDDSVVTGASSELFLNNVFDSFTLTSGPIGATNFDLSNTYFQLGYVNGVLVNFFLGGDTDGSNNFAGSVFSNTDDFRVFQNPGSSLSEAVVSTANATGNDRMSGVGSLIVTSIVDDEPSAVPNPATLALLLLGLAPMLLRRLSARRLC